MIAPATDWQVNIWLPKTTIRSSSIPTLDLDEVDSKDFFSADQVAILGHDLIQQRDPEVIRKLLIQHLYTYMHFTDQLELKAVNLVAQKIAHNEMDVRMSHEVRAEAHATYTDEGWHALICGNLMEQIEKATRTTPVYKGEPAFLQRLRKIKAELPADLRDLSDFFFVVVSETMISGTLAKVPKDKNVVTAVREMLGDHAADEGRHHKYFSQLFGLLWPMLDERQRKHIGPILPKFIRAFIDPDHAAIGSVLALHGFNEAEVNQVIDETYSPIAMREMARNASAATVNLFKRNGVLDDNEFADAFAECGLVSSDSKLKAAAPIGSNRTLETATCAAI